MKEVYLDNAATTAVKPEVLDAMMPYLTYDYGNPSSIYGLGISVRDAIDDARVVIAESIGADPDEIYFTSGGSEANSWAIKCGSKDTLFRNNIITSNIEHHSVLNAAKQMERDGWNVKIIPSDNTGIVHADALKEVINKKTTLVSVMSVNNEIGTVQPIRELARIAHDNGAYFHTDAVQAFPHLPIDVWNDDIDMMSVSGHKFGAPKGVGFLYVKHGICMEPLINGGGQERGVRGGTENVAGIIGLAEAVKLLRKKRMPSSELVETCKYFYDRLLNDVDGAKLNGIVAPRIATTINVRFNGIRSEQLLEFLNERGIYVSSGSACNSSSGKPSHVLKAIGLSDEEASSSIRFSLGEDITKEDIDAVIKEINNFLFLVRGI